MKKRFNKLAYHSALLYSWLNVSNMFDAGERCMFLFDADAESSDSTTELAVALKHEALMKNRDALKSFTLVDFIVISPKMKDSIQSQGIGSLSSDVKGNGKYRTREEFIAYVAASIPFDYFRNQSKAASSTNESMSPALEDPIVKFIIGNGFCPANLPSPCQNGKLRENAAYWYA